MARSVTFNGITRFRPGGITKINADALNQVGISANNVIGLIGEADGGEPGSSAGLVSFRDPSQAVETYREGPLVDAIRLAFDSSGDPNIPGGAAEVVVYKVNASTQSSIHIPDPNTNLFSGTVAAASTTTSINVTGGGMTVNAYQNRWVDITLAAVPGSPVYRRRITANSATALTVTPALPSAPVATNPLAIKATLYTVTSSDYGLHTTGVEHDLTYDDTELTYQATVEFEGDSQTSESLGGDNYLKIEYLGGTNAVAQDTILTPGTVTTTSFDLTAGALTPAAHAGATVVVTNPATGNSERVKATTNGANTITLEAPGLSADFVTEIQAATLSTVTVDILTVTNAVATITGASGVATALTTTITGVTGDNLNIAITSSMTLQQLVNAINAYSTYSATVPSKINAATTYPKNFDFGTSTAINIQRSVELSTLGFKQDLYNLVNWFNTNSVYATATRYTGASADGAMLPRSATTVDTLFTEPFALVGGTRGISTNSNWQSAFDEMLTRQVNYVVPLIDQDLSAEGNSSTATWASVSAQLASHVTTARGAAGLERGGFIGLIGTKTELIEAANDLNDADIQLVGQNPTVLNASGTLEEMTPRMFAVMAASMRAGVQEVGEPLTYKFVKVSSLTQDSTWNPADLTDSADLILNGVLFAETIPGQGTRWVRDLTTWVKDDNLAYTEGSVRDIVRYVAYNLRTTLVDRFTGKKAKPATIAAVKDAAVALLEQFRKDGVIVDSTDPITGTTVRAYTNLKVYTTGDVLTLRVQIFPVPGINFQLSEIFLQMPSQSA